MLEPKDYQTQVTPFEENLTPYHYKYVKLPLWNFFTNFHHQEGPLFEAFAY